MKDDAEKRILFVFIISLLIVSALNSSIIIHSAIKSSSENILTGEHSTVGRVGLRIMSPCEIYLLEGWNFISICSNETNANISNIFNKTDYRYIMEWNPSTQEFLIYSPRAETNPFDEINLSRSYFIYSFGSQILSTTGDEFSSMKIPLLEGWNTPAYPYVFATDIEKYLETPEMSGKYRYLMKWNESAQEFLIYSPRAETNPFEKIFKGQGQFVNMYSATNLFYNKTYLK